MSDLRVALVGTGSIARRHAAAAVAHDGAELVAVVNHRPESRAAVAADFGIRREHAALGDLLEAGAIDAIVICTPNALHAEQATRALRAGIHVLVEKPMSLSASEAAQIADARRETGCTLMVAHCWRFDPDVRWLRDQVLGGALGRVVRTTAFASHVNWGPAGWFVDPVLAGGGATLDLGVHGIDTTRYVLGDPEPASVAAKIGTHYRDIAVDDTSSITVTWADGAYSSIESGWWQPHAGGPLSAIHVYGTHGFGQLFPPRIVLDEGARIEEPPGGGFAREEHMPQAIFDAQFAHFAACIASGDEPVAASRHGVVNASIIDAAYASAASGRVEAAAACVA